MQISGFDYELPSELIAQEPLEERDASRMLVVNRRERRWVDSEFRELSNYLRPGDVLVLNNTRVFPARLIGRRETTGGRVEVLLVRQLEPAFKAMMHSMEFWMRSVRPRYPRISSAQVVQHRKIVNVTRRFMRAAVAP